jgi:hypothetical protein
MRPGICRFAVTLYRRPKTSGDSNGYEEALTPSAWWCGIVPYQGQTDGRATIMQVTMRFHPQVDLDTIIRLPDATLGRERVIHVLGVQDVENKHAELLLTCEEVWP